MNIQYCTNYEDLSQKAFEYIVSDLKEKPDQLICAATGNSPTGTYKKLAQSCIKEPKIFEALRILKLDEWGGINLQNPNSCERYIQEHILEPLSIQNDRYISFASNPTLPEKECKRIQSEIEKNGQIDICILGLGKNGHIGLNEPATVLMPNCHVAQLSQQTLQHQITTGMEETPSYGLTIGVADILKSRKIILLITGGGKKESIEKLLNEQIDTHLPASFLWLHPHVECYIDSESLKD